MVNFMSDSSITGGDRLPELEEIALRYQVDLEDLRDLQDGTWLMVGRLLFHWTVRRGTFLDVTLELDRWCYRTEAGARSAFSIFPQGPPPNYEPEGWYRHPPTGRFLHFTSDADDE